MDQVSGVTISLEVRPLPIGAVAAERTAAELHMRALHQRATWAGADGSATARVLNGGAGCLIPPWRHSVAAQRLGRPHSAPPSGKG